MNVPSLIPRPAALRSLAQGFSLSKDTVIIADEAAAAVARTLAASLRPATGFALPIQAAAADATGHPTIRLTIDAAIPGEEAYGLRVGASGADLIAGTTAGLFMATQTLRQLLPPQIYAYALVQDVDWALPGVLIEDAPRFVWRDLMLDVSRHFMPIEFIYRLIDLMAMHKLNRFHWHLTDDQGWRIEIRKYPGLTEVGSWRARTQLGHKYDRPVRYDQVRRGGFYTQPQIRSVVRYAAARHIVIVPEIDMPGHVQAAIAAYPSLGNGAQVAVSERWEITPHVLNMRESTISFMQDVLLEVMDLFPGQQIHIGGDECPKTEWKTSQHAQALIRDQELGDEDGLQSWFIRRMAAFLADHGRQLIGWDEILQGGLAEGAIVMSWQGMEGGIEAAQAGHDVIMTPQASVYLDYYQVENFVDEPLAIRGTTTLRDCYGFEPVPDELTPAEAARVLGTCAKLWTEYVATPTHAEYMLLPRLCAIAEVAWSPRAPRDFADFHRRMVVHQRRLTAAGWRGRPLEPYREVA
jgi:hexosaminidase